MISKTIGKMGYTIFRHTHIDSGYTFKAMCEAFLGEQLKPALGITGDDFLLNFNNWDVTFDMCELLGGLVFALAARLVS